MHRLLVATHNAHKTAEIQAMLGPEFLVSDLRAHPHLPIPEETGTTFAENARIKAVAAAPHVPGWILSDDSGLESDALEGAPGVHSARYAGAGATDADNRARLLSELHRVGADPAGSPARFRCVMCLVFNGSVQGSFSGSVEGLLIGSERGVGGFGYDPLFVPEGHTHTFAELSQTVKNSLSHRSRALAQVIQHLRLALETGC
jgi:XTP/dITP diphosphohydrolase